MFFALADHQYVGCFADNTNNVRDLSIENDALTADGLDARLDECASQCAGYRYMGLQETSECLCGNSYGSQGGRTCPSDCGLATSGTGCANKNAVYRLLRASVIVSATFAAFLPQTVCQTRTFTGPADTVWATLLQPKIMLMSATASPTQCILVI